MTDCTHPNEWFDRSICPDPCGSMHYYCTDCGKRMGRCALDEQRERARIEQSNDVAAIVSTVLERHGLFAYLNLRYDVADAIHAAGYRKEQSNEYQ